MHKILIIIFLVISLYAKDQEIEHILKIKKIIQTEIKKEFNGILKFGG